MNKKIYNVEKIIVISLSVLFVGWWFLFGNHTPTAAKPSVVNKALFRVFVEKSQAQEREIVVNLYGETIPTRQVDVHAQTVGRIQEVVVKKGQRVNQGDLLAVLEVEDRKKRVQEAKNSLHLAQIKHKTSDQLLKKGIGSQSTLVEAKSNLRKAEAMHSTAIRELDRINIRAPFPGVVDDIKVEVGSKVYPNNTRIGTVYDLNKLKVSAIASEQEIGHIKEGSQANVELASGEKVTGKVVYRAHIADERTHTFDVEVEIPNHELRYPSGMSANVTIPYERAKAHFVSPALLSLKDDGTVGLKSVDEEGKVLFYPVKIAATENEGVWVTGLPDRTHLIMRGKDFVEEGQMVEAVFEEPQE